jgi:hypothetical protein
MYVLSQEVVDCLEIEEIPESLLIDMGTLQYRSTLLSMIEKVRDSELSTFKVASNLSHLCWVQDRVL